MGVFSDMFKLGSTAALDCWTAKTKADIIKKSSYSYLSCCVIGQGDLKDVASVGGLLL